MPDENTGQHQTPKSTNGDKNGCFGCLGVLVILAGCIFFIFKPATDKDQEWSKNVKASVPSHWTQISERDSRITINNPLTWGDKGVGQIYYLLDAQKVNRHKDWLVTTAFIRREPYEYNPGTKTELGYVSISTDIINFDVMQQIYELQDLPKYKNLKKFTKKHALEIIREEKFEDAYKEGACDIKKAIDSRK